MSIDQLKPLNRERFTHSGNQRVVNMIYFKIVGQKKVIRCNRMTYESIY